MYTLSSNPCSRTRKQCHQHIHVKYIHTITTCSSAHIQDIFTHSEKNNPQFPILRALHLPTPHSLQTPSTMPEPIPHRPSPPSLPHPPSPTKTPTKAGIQADILSIATRTKPSLPLASKWYGRKLSVILLELSTLYPQMREYHDNAKAVREILNIYRR